MNTALVFHHIGYATVDIDQSASAFERMGYRRGPVFVDPIQRTLICFLTKDQEPSIELVQPADETSSVNKIVSKRGVTPYHLCYETPDIDRSFDELMEEGFIPLFRPVEAIAFGDRRICYFFKKETGYLELVEQGA